MEVSARAVSHISPFRSLCNSWQLDNISDIWELICKKNWWNEAILSYKHKSNDIFQLCRLLFIEWKLCNCVYSFNCHYKVFPTYNSYLINEPNHHFRRFSKTLEQVIVLEKCLKQMNNEKLYFSHTKKNKPLRYSAPHTLEFLETGSWTKYFFCYSSRHLCATILRHLPSFPLASHHTLKCYELPIHHKATYKCTALALPIWSLVFHPHKIILNIITFLEYQIFILAYRSWGPSPRFPYSFCHWLWS